MVGLGHGAAGEREREHAPTVARNARSGLILFAIYLVLYLGFMLISAFWPDVLDRIVFAGINLAIVYGFGLILAAIVLALLYSWICRTPARETSVREDRV